MYECIATWRFVWLKIVIICKQNCLLNTCLERRVIFARTGLQRACLRINSVFACACFTRCVCYLHVRFTRLSRVGKLTALWTKSRDIDVVHLVAYKKEYVCHDA